MNNQSKLISGKDSNRSQPKSGNDKIKPLDIKSPAGVESLEAWSPMTL